MKKKTLTQFVLRFLLCISLSAVFAFSIITFAIPRQHESSYQSVLVRQYNAYKNMSGNKIVVLGHSSLAFGFDQDLMSELTGIPCQMIGIHGGIGMEYLMNMAKSNLLEGDIVILEYAGSSTVSPELLLTGLENNIEPYQFIPISDIDDFVEQFPTYAVKKIKYFLNIEKIKYQGLYCANAFDEKGNMIKERGTTIPENYDRSFYGEASWSEFVPEEVVLIYNDFIAYCKNKNIQVLVTVSPYIDEAILSSKEEIIASNEALQEQLDAPLVSSSLDYIFSREYMGDTIAHCNTLGAKKRTIQLYEDIKEYLQ
ncbi:MAG: hypothetical protein ACOX3W_02585 [Christensenellaceae bacterium]|jgi:hypothetical protein